MSRADLRSSAVNYQEFGGPKEKKKRKKSLEHWSLKLKLM
jgi:hypothetical protein